VTIHTSDSENFGRPIDSFTPGSEGKLKFGMSVSYSPDDRLLALSTENGQIYVFDVSRPSTQQEAENGTPSSASLVHSFNSHTMSVRSMTWSPDSQLLLSCSDDKRLALHDVRAGHGGGARQGSGAVASLSGHSSWVLNADISPDGRLAASSSADGTVKVWDIGTRQCVSTIQENGEVWGVSWRPQGGSALVSGGTSSLLRWWRGAGVSLGAS
jgi:WD repeat-containing protein 61